MRLMWTSFGRGVFTLFKDNFCLEWSVVKLRESYQNCESRRPFWHHLFLSIGVNTFTCSQFCRVIIVSLTVYMMT